MDEALGANVAELTRALKSKGVPLPHEVGTFIALEVANALVVRPCAVTASSVFVNGQGQVAVAELPKASELQAVSSVLMLLGELLVASAPGVPESLLALVEEASEPTRVRTVKALRDELEAALVPLNRAATMRILGRIAKDAFGSRRLRTAEPNARSQGDITSAIDAMLGVDSAEADALRADVDASVPSGLPVSDASHAPTLPISDSPQLQDDVSRMDDRPAGGLRFLLLVLLFVLIAGGVAYFVRQGALGENETSSPQGQPAAVAHDGRDAGTVSPQAVTVHVDSVPRGSQVLLEVPEAVHEVRVAQDVAHEFVAVYGDGSARRLVIAPGRKPTEADLQLHGKLDLVGTDLGPSRLDALAADEPEELTRVIQLNAPQDARIYKLVGLTPTDVSLSPRTKSATFMLYRRGFARTELTVTPEELDQARSNQVDGGAPALALSTRLSPLS